MHKRFWVVFQEAKTTTFWFQLGSVSVSVSVWCWSVIGCSLAWWARAVTQLCARHETPPITWAETANDEQAPKQTETETETKCRFICAGITIVDLAFVAHLLQQSHLKHQNWKHLEKNSIKMQVNFKGCKSFYFASLYFRKYAAIDDPITDTFL